MTAIQMHSEAPAKTFASGARIAARLESIDRARHARDVEGQEVDAGQHDEPELQLQEDVALQDDIRMDVDVCVDAGHEQQPGDETEHESEHAPRNEFLDGGDRELLRHAEQPQIENANRADEERHADKVQALRHAPHPQVSVDQVLDARPPHPVPEEFFHRATSSLSAVSASRRRGPQGIPGSIRRASWPNSRRRRGRR